MRKRQNTHGRITKPMKIFLSEFKTSPVIKKINITEINGYIMSGEWTETDCQT
jgi:hypothetical protein